MIAPEKPPAADATITARLVAMKRALPRPHPARKPTMPAMLPDIPASAENTTMRARPTTRVRLEPKRDDTAPTTIMATAVTTRQGRDACLGEPEQGGEGRFDRLPFLRGQGVEEASQLRCPVTPAALDQRRPGLGDL